MQAILNQFLFNIASVKELNTLYYDLKHTQKLSNDLSDLLRAEIVYVISALDKLVHELVRNGMIAVFKGVKPKTSAYEGFTLSAKTLDKIRETTIERALNPDLPPTSQIDSPEYWFEQQIILTHKSESYQDPAKISKALSLIWNEPYKWQKIATKMGLTPKEEKSIQNFLTDIVERRNKIVHEADTDIVSNTKHTITESETIEMVGFIEKLGKAIYECVV